MSEQLTAELSPETVEQVLREELAQGDLAIASARPILRHLLTNDDQALFSDEIISRIRGMARNIARQLLEAQAEAEGMTDRTALTHGRQDVLAQALCQDA